MAGDAKTFTLVASLVDTNILVHVFDTSEPRKQHAAIRLPDRGLHEDSLRVPHQAIVEFVAAVTRPRANGASLVSRAEVHWEAKHLMDEFEILYPNESLVRAAMRGAAAYRLPWFDAHIWAYAEHYGLSELYSEDFEHDRLYGTVRAVNLFIG